MSAAVSIEVPTLVVYAVLAVLALALVFAACVALLAFVISPLVRKMHEAGTGGPHRGKHLYIIRERLAEPPGKPPLDSKELRFRSRRFSWSFAGREHGVLIGHIESPSTNREGE